MKVWRIIIMAALAIAVASCAGKYEEWEGGIPGGPDSPQPGGNGGATATIGTLTEFEIEIDQSELAENETIPTDDEDYAENNTFDKEIVFTFENSEVTVEGEVPGVDISMNGAHVVINSTAEGVAYRLTGYTGDGSVKIYGEHKYKLYLDDITINNPDGAAINSQCKKRVFAELTEGSYNSLSDGSKYIIPNGEDMKATFFTEGKLLMSGKGKLKVEANAKAGIASDDYILLRPGVTVYVEAVAGNGVKANDGIFMRGGVVNILNSAPAGKGFSSDGDVTIEGGRFIAITSGDGTWDKTEKDLNNAAGIKADGNVTITGGTVRLKSTGAGGKGISSDQAVNITGGAIDIITTGTTYSYNEETKLPKGIKADGDLSIGGGAVRVRATGGEGAEGIESKGTITISDGTIEVYAYDDGINAGKALNISGGQVFSYAINNDGIDSNGPITISGGSVATCGTTMPENGIDCDQNTFSVTGGSIIAIGGGTSVPATASTTQPVVICGGTNLYSGFHITLLDGEDNFAFALKVPRSYSNYTVLASSPLLKLESGFSLIAGGSVTAGNNFDGFITNGSLSNGKTLASQTLTSTVTTFNFNGGSGGTPGGEQPGGEQPGDNPPGDNPPGDNPPGDNPPGDNPPGNE